MLNSGPSGFHNAPVSKALLLLTGGSSVLVSIMNLKSTFNFLAISSIIQPGRWEIWRIVTNHFPFNTAGEVLFGVALIYYFRLFERQMGSSKFAAFVALSMTLSSLTQIALYVLFPGMPSISSGPYSFIFSCFVLFFSHVPATYKFQICGINSNDKLFVYLMGFQLLLSNFPSSFLSACIGILSGVAYNSEALKLTRLQTPAIVNNFCRRFILPLLKSPPPNNTRPTAIPPPSEARQRATTQQRTPPAFTHNLSPMPFVANPEAIEQLMHMGFTREQATQSLQRANGDLILATNMLLDGSFS